MGGTNITTHNLRIMKIDTVLNILYVKGAVTGPKGSVVRLRDAIFRRDLHDLQFDPLINPPPFPSITEDELSNLPQELTVDSNDQVDPIARRFSY